MLKSTTTKKKVSASKRGTSTEAWEKKLIDHLSGIVEEQKKQGFTLISLSELSWAKKVIRSAPKSEKTNPRNSPQNRLYILDEKSIKMLFSKPALLNSIINSPYAHRLIFVNQTDRSVTIGPPPAGTLPLDLTETIRSFPQTVAKYETLQIKK